MKAVILIGGPSKGTRFRPLSLDLPKPLFPIAEREMLHHHVEACVKLPQLEEILLIGFYEESLFSNFIEQTSKKFNVIIRYLKESKPSGTAGGLHAFKSEVLLGSPNAIFVLHVDICSAFPLVEMLDFHKRHGKMATIMATKVAHDEARNYGCIVKDSNSNEMLHYAEKPETYVSDLINCGVYLFSPAIFDVISDTASSKPHVTNSADIAPLFLASQPSADSLRMEQDVLMPLAGKQQVYIFETKTFWSQIKSAGSAVLCTEMYLNQYRRIHPELLSKGAQPQIIGNVIIHPSAEIHPTAKLGPNVSIGAGARIGAGVRIFHSIILEGVDIKEHACVMYSIIGWNSTVGQWTRVEGTPNYSASSRVGQKRITIFGVGVVADPEIVVRNSIVLPYKRLTGNFHNEILL